MIIATTAATHASGDDVIVYRGSYEQMFSLIAKAGYKAVELHIYDSEQIDRKLLDELLQIHGLQLTSIGTGSAYEIDGLSLTSGQKEVRDAAIKRLEGHMKTASFHHATIIIGMIVGRFSDCSGKDEFIKNLVDSLKQCSEKAKKYQVPLVFEVMNRFESDYATNIAAALELLDLVGVDNLQLHLDTVHMNIEEDNIYQAILSAKDRIGHVHIADNNRWYPGHSHYNFEETLRALKEIGYNKTLALETNNFPSTEVSAKKSLIYLTKLLEQLE